MNASLRKTLALAALALVATTQPAHAGSLFQDQDVDPRFRAKIMKEKAKANQQMAANFSFTNGTSSAQDPQCGSQNIGNVNTSGKIGTAPQEVFVFAPNAINLVSSNGCK